MAYVIGNISGCHINPAVSLAILINKKLTVKDFIRYVIAQVIGAVIGILYGIIACSGLDVALTVLGAIITEVVLTYTILRVTSNESKSQIACVVIGLTLAFVHIMGIQLTGTSANPARSLAPSTSIIFRWRSIKTSISIHLNTISRFCNSSIYI